MTMTDDLIKELSIKAIELMVKWEKSKSKQKTFVLEYIATGFTNATEAARNAGYSEKTASTIASNMLTGMKKYEHIPPIINQIKKEFDDRQSEMKVADGTEVLRYLTSLMRGKEKEQVLRGVGMGEQTKTSIEVSAKDRIKAAELLGKRHALFTDKTEMTVTEVPVFVDDLGDPDG